MMASRNRNAESYAPTESPTTVTDGIYREQFIAAVGPKVLEYGSPHDRAASWIMNEDPQHLSASSENLIQRYILALFYFMTSSTEMEPWKSCNRPQNGESESCQFLKFYRASNDSIVFVPENATRWLSGTDECNWIGITCDTSDSASIVVALEVCKYNFHELIKSSSNRY
jgi:Leucine rich repeat N-terminal domain